MQGASVDVRMTRHAFKWGTTVSEKFFIEAFLPTDDDYDPVNGQIYRDKIPEYFNTITAENGMKWGKWEDPVRRDMVEQLVDWARVAAGAKTPRLAASVG